jgi:Predicted enzyme related to lactoylglutathione lyase
VNLHEKLNYVEFSANNLTATQQFFSTVFDWTFTHYGPEYTAFDYQGLEGGFYLGNASSSPERGGALLVFYSEDLRRTQVKIEAAGGVIVKAIFDFPGGRRFHFCEPSGNEFAVWSDN